MSRKTQVILLIMLVAPVFVWAAGATEIEATSKLKNLVIGGSRVFGGVICLLAVVSNGMKEAIKSIMAEERTQADNKNIMTRFGYLAIGLVVMFFANSIVDFILGFL